MVAPLEKIIVGLSGVHGAFLELRGTHNISMKKGVIVYIRRLCMIYDII
jgi:hypothetical protein